MLPDIEDATCPNANPGPLLLSGEGSSQDWLF